MADNNPLKVSFVDPIQLNVNLPNVKGDAGKDGDSAYLTAVKNGFVGTEREWLESLKAKVDVTPAYETLMRNNVYCASKDIADVLNGFITGLGDLAKKQAKPLEYDTPLAGQIYISISGEPHYKVALSGASKNERVEIESTDKFRFNLNQPFGGDNITLEYFNMLGEKVSTVAIEGSANIKTTLSSGDIVDRNTETVDYPEVTTLEKGALGNLSNIKTINLPKVTTIKGYQNLTCFNLQSINIPQYVIKSGEMNNGIFNFNAFNIYDLVVNEQSDIGTLSQMIDYIGQINIYNQDKTKKFDKATKTWVSAQ